MFSEIQRHLSLSFAENVALLSLLRRAPIAPQTNPRTPAVVDRNPGRILSFERETSLTNTLAFLAGISDHPAHVVATCVEELPGGKGIRVVIAINRAGQNRGNEVLARIKKGLEEIFGHLSQAKNEAEYSVVEDRVFNAIADMCKHRIVSRIRSRKFKAMYRKLGLAFLGSTIQQTLDAVRRYGSSKPFRLNAERFMGRARVLLERLAELEACQERDIVSHIKHVLHAAHRINRPTEFDDILSEIPAKELDPSTGRGFVIRIGKLAMYRECSLYLLQTAKEFSLFENTEVTCVSLDEKLFSSDLTIPPGRGLASCLSRLQVTAPKNTLPPKEIMGELPLSDSNFTSRVKKVLKKSRVHAEVQIVCYYELHPVTRKPRVICSSKDACYLCDLFVKLHGMFHIPKTHGNLYPVWRLLPIPTLDHVLARLNEYLAAQIREIIPGVMTKPGLKRRLSQNVNESTTFPFSTSLPALTSSTLLAESQGMSATEQHPQERHHDPIPEPSTAPLFQTTLPGPPDLVSPNLDGIAVDPLHGSQTRPVPLSQPARNHFKFLEGRTFPP